MTVDMNDTGSYNPLDLSSTLIRDAYMIYHEYGP